MKKIKFVSIVLLGLLVIIIVLALPKNSAQAFKGTKDYDFKTENLVAELNDKGNHL